MALNFLNNGYFAGKVGIGVEVPTYTLELQVSQPDENPVVYSQFGGNNGVTGNSFLQIGGARGSAASERYSYLQTLDGAGGFRILSLNPNGGNVGIGTTTPYLKLHVAGNTRVQGNLMVGDAAASNTPAAVIHIKSSGTNAKLRIEDSDNANQYWDFLVDQGNALYFNEDTDTRVTFKEGGNVGIGTTNPSSTKPTGSEVATGWAIAGSKALEISAANYANTGLLLRNNSNTTGTDITADHYFGNTFIDNRYDSDVGDIIFRTRTAGTPQIRMLIEGGGNVGIGTTAPSQKLHISGNMRLTGAFRDRLNSQGAANYVLTSTGSNGTQWVDASGSSIIGGPYLPLAGGTMTGVAGVVLPDNFILNIGTSNDLTIKHNATDSFIENHTGHLSVVNYSNDKDIIFWGDDGTGGIAQYLVIDGSKADGTGNLYTNFPDKSHLTFGSKPNGDLQIYHDGSNSYIKDVGTGSLFIQGSDIFIKTNLTENAIVAQENGKVELFHNNITKFQTTSTGVSVTGAAFINGNTDNSVEFLTVDDGDPTVGSQRPHIKFTGAGTQLGKIRVLDNGVGMQFLNSADSIKLTIADSGNATFAGTLNSDNITVGKGDGNNSFISLTANTGNWTFTNVQASRNLEISDSDGTGVAMTIDTNANATFAGDVNIGTATVAAANAAADDLHLKSLGSNGITISSGNAQTGTIFFGDVANAAVAGFRYNHNTGDMAISAEDNITFACDNVGIGTTLPTSQLFVNNTADGDKIRWGRSDALVGSVGTFNGVPYIGYQGGAGGGIMFNGSSIEPTLLGSSRSSNTNDIGSPNYKWRNAYFGNQVSAANYIAAAAEGLRINDSAAYVSGYNTAGTQRTGYLQFLNGSGTILIDSEVGNRYIVMASTSTAKVGIGTTTPNYKLTVSGGINAGGVVTYSKVAGSLNTTGYAIAGLGTVFNGASAGFTFTAYGGTGQYQKVVYSCFGSGTNWVVDKVIDEGTNVFDIEASASSAATIVFTFKTRSGSQSYSPRVVIEATGHSIISTYA